MWHHFVAYIDPGSGSLFLQASIGAVLGLGYTLRNSIKRVVGAIAPRRRTDSESSDS